MRRRTSLLPIRVWVNLLMDSAIFSSFFSSAQTLRDRKKNHIWIYNLSTNKRIRRLNFMMFHFGLTQQRHLKFLVSPALKRSFKIAVVRYKNSRKKNSIKLSRKSTVVVWMNWIFRWKKISSDVTLILIINIRNISTNQQQYGNTCSTMFYTWLCETGILHSAHLVYFWFICAQPINVRKRMSRIKLNLA